MSVRWVVQKNLIEEDGYYGLCMAVKQQEFKCTTFTMMPDDDMPIIMNDMPTVFYGTTFMVQAVVESNFWKPAVWFNHDNFRFESYHKAWGELMFNYPFEKTTIQKVLDSDRKPLDVFFMRPDKDLKEFTGCAIEFRELLEWQEDGNIDVPLDTVVITAEAKEIAHEWRLVILDGKVLTQSQYMKDGKFAPSPDVPKAVIDLASQASDIWTPERIFSLDIAEANDKLSIMECNCFNCSGLYAMNKHAIVREVSKIAMESE